MFHKHRRHQVVDVTDLEELATKLTEHTWCTCNGFRLPFAVYNDEPCALLLLNDSTSADGAQEYAVVIDDVVSDGGISFSSPDILYLNVDASRQVESVTFGWMTPERALLWLKAAINGQGLCDDWPTPIHVERPEAHKRCPACA